MNFTKFFEPYKSMLVKLFFFLFVAAYLIGIWKNAYDLEKKLLDERKTNEKYEDIINKIQANNVGLKNQIGLDQKEINELKRANDFHQYQSALLKTSIDSFIFSLPIKYIKQFQEKKKFLESEFNSDEHRNLSSSQNSKHKTDNS